MKRFLIAGGLALAIGPSASAHHDITLRGCVVPGLDKGTFVLSRATEVVPAAGSAMPEAKDGRRIVFWLDDAKNFRDHAGTIVEVRGEVDHEPEESEIEVKAGPYKDGGLIVEFEGPGKDVRVSNETVGDAIGTSGRTEPGKDIKMLIVRIDVDNVDRVEGAAPCAK